MTDHLQGLTTQQRGKRLRHDRLIELMGSPKTLAEMAEDLSCSYYTVRNDVDELLKEGKCRQVPMLGRNGAAQYVSGGNRAMPVVIPRASNAPSTLQQIALNVGQMPSLNGLGSVNAAKTVMTTVLELCHEAASAVTTGVPPSQERLVQLRKGLVDARFLLGSQADVADQLIKMSNLWDNAELPRIGEDEEFNHKLIEEAYGKYLTYLESVTPLITSEVNNGESSPAMESADN